jgi:tRNA-specific 2-thiouridylase
MKPDSQDICFVPDGDYASVVRKVRPDAERGGDIVDMEGRVLGAHKGLIHYTVGQRKGLELGGLPEPLYVIRLEAGERSRVIVGPKRALAVQYGALVRTQLAGGCDQGPLFAKVRSLAKARTGADGGRPADLRRARIWRRTGSGGGAL